MPLGDVPAVPELPWALPEVDGDEFELDDPEPDDPVFGVDEFGVPAVPGKVPHGEPLGVVPGVLEVFGFTVDGCVLLPGVAGLVEFEPGTVDEEPGVEVPVGGGVEVPVGGGVEVPVGGAADPVGKVAVPGA